MSLWRCVTGPCVSFTCGQVVQGLIKVVSTTLITLNQQMSQAFIAKNQLPPMLELEMHLSGGKVSVSYVRHAPCRSPYPLVSLSFP